MSDLLLDDAPAAEETDDEKLARLAALEASTDSATLRRLIAEVTNDVQTGEINAYNRMHNRHNRSGRSRWQSDWPTHEGATTEKKEKPAASPPNQPPECPKGGRHKMDGGKPDFPAQRSVLGLDQKTIYTCEKCGWQTFIDFNAKG